jgi:hypothetical protein
MTRVLAFGYATLAALTVAIAAVGTANLASAEDVKVAAVAPAVTSKFAGVKVNGGTVSATVNGGRIQLTLSSDFQIPDTPAPHWQVVDSSGNTYLLQRLKIKDDKVNKTITVPAYVRDVAKVQIWCAWAEVLLGESSFEKPVK